jgi:hypothetical protein
MRQKIAQWIIGIICVLLLISVEVLAVIVEGWIGLLTVPTVVVTILLVAGFFYILDIAVNG